MTKLLRLLLVCVCFFCTAISIPLAIAAPATALDIPPSRFIIYNNNNNHSLLSNSPITFTLSPTNSTPVTESWNPPPDPWIRRTSSGGTIILNHYGSASFLDPHSWAADISDVLAQARAEAAGRPFSTSITRRLDYVEEHAYFYVRPLMSGVTWDIWLAALEQLANFHGSWTEYTFYFRIVQPTRDGGVVSMVLADGQLRVL